MHLCPFISYTTTHNQDFACPITNEYYPPTSPENKPNPATLDFGPNPFVINIEEATKNNDYFRVALWTGEHLQLTLMSIDVGDDIGLEMHPDVDQFLRIEEGEGLVQMGNSENNLNFQRKVFDDYVILVPAGKWHNLTNVGDKPIKLYSIYAPPEHPHGTVHKTKEEAEEAESI
ncbi:MAG: cupin domain-containing protein [Clostridiales bacterium]|nr:cupin domain-containing protein [Clostridiales bacterium]